MDEKSFFMVSIVAIVAIVATFSIVSVSNFSVGGGSVTGLGSAIGARTTVSNIASSPVSTGKVQDSQQTSLFTAAAVATDVARLQNFVSKNGGANNIVLVAVPLQSTGQSADQQVATFNARRAEVEKAVGAMNLQYISLGSMAPGVAVAGATQGQINALAGRFEVTRLGSGSSVSATSAGSATNVPPTPVGSQGYQGAYEQQTGGYTY